MYIYIAHATPRNELPTLVLSHLTGRPWARIILHTYVSTLTRVTVCVRARRLVHTRTCTRARARGHTCRPSSVRAIRLRVFSALDACVTHTRMSSYLWSVLWIVHVPQGGGGGGWGS